MTKEIAYDLYADAYVEIEDPEPPPSIDAMFRMGMIVDTMVADAMLEFMEVYKDSLKHAALYGMGYTFFSDSDVRSIRLSDMLDPPPRMWLEPEPQTLRERERAHVRRLNGGDKPWKAKRR